MHALNLFDGYWWWEVKWFGWFLMYTGSEQAAVHIQVNACGNYTVTGDPKTLLASKSKSRIKHVFLNKMCPSLDLFPEWLLKIITRHQKNSWSTRQCHAIEPFSWCTLRHHRGIAHLMKLVLVLFADWELNSDLISGLSFRSEFWQGLVPGALEGQVTPLRASLSLGLPFFLTPCPRPWFTIFSGKVQTAPGPDSLWKYSPAPIQPIPP